MLIIIMEFAELILTNVVHHARNNQARDEFPASLSSLHTRSHVRTILCDIRLVDVDERFDG